MFQGTRVTVCTQAHRATDSQYCRHDSDDVRKEMTSC